MCGSHSNRILRRLAFLSLVPILCAGWSCDLLSAKNIAINPDGSERQLCSGRFFTGDNFELCRRDGDGALGGFEVFLSDVVVTKAGEVMLAGMPIGIAEITQTFPGLGVTPEGEEITFTDLFWELKSDDGSLLWLQEIAGLPKVQAAVAQGNSEVLAALDFIESFTRHYFLNQNRIVAAESGVAYGIDHFFGCIDARPDLRDLVCAQLYDLNRDGTLDQLDYVTLISIVDSVAAAEQIISVDVDLSLYHTCTEASFNDDEEESISPACRPLDINNSGTVDQTDLRQLLDVNTDVDLDNTTPVASAGSDQTVVAGETAFLNGSESFDTETSVADLLFTWEQVFGLEVTLEDRNRASAHFTAPGVVDRTEVAFQLTVTDAGGLSDSDTVTITVLPEGPVADAGDDVVAPSGNLVTLNGSGSTGQDITFFWSQVTGLPVSLSSNVTASPIFPAPVVSSATVLTFQLAVTDENGLVDSDTVDVTVTPGEGGAAVVADAGVDQQVTSGALVTLDGSQSEGTDLTYTWEQVFLDGLDPGVALSSSTTAEPVFEAPVVAVPTTLRFRLTVTDSGAQSNVDEVDITVLPGATE